MREFDLNIQRVLEHWTVAHALREVIANALDEQILSGTHEPAIGRDDHGSWHIRDWGRGLRYDHLTQNESPEKLARPDAVIGKFGVGLKDALATLDRHGVQVEIHSPHGDITVGTHAKQGFSDVPTLHALISEPADPFREGTEFVLTGEAVGEREVEEAKGLFLHYAGDRVIGDTAFGTVLEPDDGPARVYVNGLRVATEDDFLFSYNITSTTKALRQALNRERSNVGRSAYTERVKAILLACDEPAVIEALVGDLQRFESGNQHHETGWSDVGAHTCGQLNSTSKVIFLTPNEQRLAPEVIQRAGDEGCQVVVVPDRLRDKLRGAQDAQDNPIRDLDQYRAEWADSFRFRLIDPRDLTDDEQAVWGALPRVFAEVGGRPGQVREVAISETMRLMHGSHQEAVGLWEPDTGRIVVKRDQLASLDLFAGTVLHEVAHALSGAPDVSLAFEQQLTRQLGLVTTRRLTL